MRWNRYICVHRSIHYTAIEFVYWWWHLFRNFCLAEYISAHSINQKCLISTIWRNEELYDWYRGTTATIWVNVAQYVIKLILHIVSLIRLDASNDQISMIWTLQHRFIIHPLLFDQISYYLFVRIPKIFIFSYDLCTMWRERERDIKINIYFLVVFHLLHCLQDSLRKI